MPKLGCALLLAGSALACGKSTAGTTSTTGTTGTTETAWATPRLSHVPASSRACLSGLPAEPRAGDGHVTGFVPILDGHAPGPRLDAGKVSLTLTSASHVRATTPLGLGVAWDNHTAKPVSLVHAVYDGSYRRNAEYALYARDKATGRTSVFVDHTIMMCGTLNRFAEADHHALPPGGHFDAKPYSRTGNDQGMAAIDVVGQYTIWLAYRFCGYSDVAGETYDVTKPDVFTGIAVSNAVEIEID